jgi:hypothetical protein
MSIASLDGYIASAKQKPVIVKSASKTSIAYCPFTVFDLAGVPAAGVLSPGNTAAGVVPENTTQGYPPISTIGATGYLARVIYINSVVSNLHLYDEVFAAGAYAYNADITLASQPSFVSRMPGANYNNTELWYECVTAISTNQSIQVNYLDQDGNAGDTGVIALGIAPTQGRMFRLPLAAGDSGISQITRVRSTGATAGTFNVIVLRPLWMGRITVANELKTDDLLKTGMPQVYNTSALYLVAVPDSTATGYPYVMMEIADG